ICKKIFHRPACWKPRYCSRKCGWEGMRRRAAVKVRCSFCNKKIVLKKGDLEKKRSRYRNVFCGPKCFGKQKTAESRFSKKCPQCGKVMHGDRYKVTHRKYCSRNCMYSAVKIKFKKKVCRFCGKS